MGCTLIINKILITGACGYLGSVLIRDLTRKTGSGCNAILAGNPIPHEDFEDLSICLLDNMQNGRYDALFDLSKQARYQFIEGDLLDPATMRYALEEVDVVVHLAAIVRTPMSFDNPTWMQQINYWGTAQLVESILLSGKRPYLIFASTTAVYGPGGPFDEKDVCRPQGHYAQSKYRAEEAIQVGMERGLRATILRIGQLYGVAPVIRFGSVINRLCTQAGMNRPITIHGTGEQRRTFVHVRDASAAIMHILDKLKAKNEKIQAHFNIVASQHSIVELVEVIKQIRPAVQIRYTEQDIRTHYSFESTSSQVHLLGWTPQISLETGVEELLSRFP